MAGRAVLLEERVEIQQIVRSDHFRALPGTAGRVVASGDDESRHDPSEPRPGTYARTQKVHRSSLPSFSFMIPGASIPARTANGRNCRVLTRCWRTTTSPATTPNPICEATNHFQSISSSIRGLITPKLVYSSPDHTSGAINPPRTIGLRGNIGSITP